MKKYYLLNNRVYAVTDNSSYVEAFIKDTVAILETGFNPNFIIFLIKDKETKEITRELFKAVADEASKMITQQFNNSDYE